MLPPTVVTKTTKKPMYDQENNLISGTKKSVASIVKRRFSAPKLASSIKKLGFWLVPGQCVLCKLASNSTVDLCECCKRDLDWLHNQCVKCGLPRAPNTPAPPPANGPNASGQVSVTDTKLFSGTRNTNAVFTRLCATSAHSEPAESLLCLRCKNGSHFTNITHTLSPLSYSGCARWLVQQQKHHKGGVEGRVLAELLSMAVAEKLDSASYPHLPDLLVPVPLHWRRQWRRGHNQSELLARYVGQNLSVPVNCSIVLRQKPTPAQQSLSARDRAANMMNAFRPSGRASIILPALPDGRVAIVDDVVTTGSTALALAQTLIDAGAKEIHLWSPTRAIIND